MALALVLWVYSGGKLMALKSEWVGELDRNRWAHHTGIRRFGWFEGSGLGSVAGIGVQVLARPPVEERAVVNRICRGFGHPASIPRAD